MNNTTIFYEGHELTQKQAYWVGHFNFRIKKAQRDLKSLVEKDALIRAQWNRGNARRREKALTDDQHTEWEFPSGKKRLQQFRTTIEANEHKITEFDTNIRDMKFKLQKYIDLATDTLPSAVPASDAPNAAAEDVEPTCSTCCPAGDQEDDDSSSSDDEDDDE